VKAGWVAATVRARLLVTHRAGDAALAAARCTSLDDAVVALAATAYGERLMPGLTLVEAQRRVAATVLWQVRVLAGWVPAAGTARLRALVGWFELSNVDQRLAELEGAPSLAPFDLGRLGSASAGRIATAGSAAELRSVLAASEWGDPGEAATALLGRWLRVAWARRVAEAAPEAAAWAYGAAALTLARDLDAGHPPALARIVTWPELGHDLNEATDVADLAARLRPRASWALAGVRPPQPLWTAETAWWRRVEVDAPALLAHGAGGPVVVTGAIALLAADAHRVAAALAVAARGADPSLLAAFDAVA
jgi:hypothetical protein